MKPRIFKLQRSIIAPGATTILAYDERREYQGEFPMDATVKKLMGRDLKIYVRGTINDAGQIEVIERVSEQKW